MKNPQMDNPTNADPQATVEALVRSIIVSQDNRLDRSHGEIARGGMASVEVAIDRTLGRRVALKLMLPEFQQSALAVRSFIREAQITGHLDHPNIVPIHDLCVDHDGRLLFTMKLVEGRTLHDLIDSLRANQDRIDPRGLRISTPIEHDDLLPLIDVFLRVLDAVAFAHSRGIAHCDIKPENVMVGDHGQVYLMDWGIARVLPERQPVPFMRVSEILPLVSDGARVVMGTPSHMSPEQARGDRDSVDHRSDVFSLGAMLFEILTGHPPYQGQDPKAQVALATACKAVLLPHLPIPRELRRIVGVAMNPDPEQRYPSVEQFRAEVLGFMRGGDTFPRRRFIKGLWLIREGEVGDAAYILVSGRCEVSKLVNGKQESLRMLGPGDVFGETSILASSARTASVLALTDVVAVVVTADLLERELDVMKPWMGAFVRALAERFSEAEDRRPGSNAADPAQIANLALMTLQTWGQRDPELGRSMSALQLCASVAKICGLSQDQVLTALRQYAQFNINLTLDLISVGDKRGLVEELSRFLRL